MTRAQKQGSTLVLGLAIMILGVLTVAQGVQARDEDKSQRTCLADNFGKLTQALNKRSELSERESKNRTRSDEAQTRLIVEVFTVAKTREQALATFARFQKVQDEVKAEAKDIAATRKANPYPPFPPGTCNDGPPAKKKPAEKPTPEQSKNTS